MELWLLASACGTSDEDVASTYGSSVHNPFCLKICMWQFEQLAETKTSGVLTNAHM